MFNEYPDFFARFYDFIYHHIRDGADNEYYIKRIRNTSGKVLEVGTGTGRLFLEALEGGANIYGIDISPSMLDVLRTKLSEKQQQRISLQNIIDFRFSTKFGLIVAPFRVFMHLTEISDQLSALNNVYDHLKSGGEFIFDTFIPDLKQLIHRLDNFTDFDREYQPGDRLKRTVSTHPDLVNQIINLTFLIEWNEGNKHFSGEWNSQMRYFFRFELEHLLERSLFDEYQIAGDFKGSPLDDNSRDFVVTCKKR
ncbi:MAG: class I SAM-dependent methyltransferase [Bacteroidales bacterium]|jgi:SAM-dependent methyltransferase|nr:class I SAM-dependent methyltransferase [Bacteroidales bacterium]